MSQGAESDPERGHRAVETLRAEVEALLRDGNYGVVIWAGLSAAPLRQGADPLEEEKESEKTAMAAGTLNRSLQGSNPPMT